MNHQVYTILIYFQLIISPIILFSLLFITAPYGRHAKKSWGPTIHSRLAWILMELPAVFTLAVIYFMHRSSIHPAAIIFLVIWEFHYLYRTFYFSFQLKKPKNNFPVLLILFALVFNVINGFINGEYLFSIHPIRSTGYFTSLKFIVGTFIFCLGFYIHYTSDRTIIKLRKKNKTEYGIPMGGMFRYLTNPNYFGEFVQWSGWAILTWSLPGIAFALFTLANLLPRAISNHKWYSENFSDYPEERKRFFPFIY